MDKTGTYTNYFCNSSNIDTLCKNSFQALDSSWKLDLSAALKFNYEFSSVGVVPISPNQHNFIFDLIYTNLTQKEFFLDIQNFSKNIYPNSLIKIQLYNQTGNY